MEVKVNRPFGIKFSINNKSSKKNRKRSSYWRYIRWRDIQPMLILQ